MVIAIGHHELEGHQSQTGTQRETNHRATSYEVTINVTLLRLIAIHAGPTIISPMMHTGQPSLSFSFTLSSYVM